MEVSAARATVAADLQFRLLTEADADAAYHVHTEVFSGLHDQSFMYQHDRSFFANLITRKGRMIGAYFDASLIAYIGLYLPGRAENRHWTLLTHLHFEREIVAEGAGGAVLPGFRKRGVYRALLRLSNEEAKSSGAQFQTSVVAPQNWASLMPLLTEGFLMAAAFEDATGMNYLLVKPLLSTVHRSGKATSVSVHDISANIGHLSRNDIGFPQPNGKHVELLYYSPEQIYVWDNSEPVELDASQAGDTLSKGKEKPCKAAISGVASR
jgi:hypothetical protein